MLDRTTCATSQAQRHEWVATAIQTCQLTSALRLSVRPSRAASATLNPVSPMSDLRAVLDFGTGHLSRWFTLPWCADSEKVEAATKLATVQQDESANHSSSPETPDPATTNITGCRGDSRLGKPLLALKSISSLRDTAGLPMKLAQRQLLAFPATPEEIEATRLAVLYGCC